MITLISNIKQIDNNNSIEINNMNSIINKHKSIQWGNDVINKSNESNYVEDNLTNAPR